MTLRNQTIVVIGGSSGIGLATARAAIAEGAQVVITGRDRERLDVAAADLGSEATPVALDASDETGTQQMFERLERINHLFVNAGSVVPDAKLTLPTADLRRAMDVRFWGAVYAVKYARPKMNDGSSIVFMSGTSAVRPIPGAAIGSASCGAVETLARALAVDLAPIRVNAIRPGLIDTPLIDRFFGERKTQLVHSYAARIPVKRIGEPEDVADAVLFLMKNRYVNGITLAVDGGAVLVQ